MSEVNSVNGKAGTVVLAATDVEAIPESEFGQPDGVATLNVSGELPEAQLPSSVVSSSSAAGIVSAITGTHSEGFALRDLVSVKDKGAKGNGVELESGGEMTVGSKTLSNAKAAWTEADIGKVIVVQGAGTGGSALVTTIAAFVTATSVTTTAAAKTTVVNATVNHGTDDTTAFKELVSNGVPAYVPAGDYFVKPGELQSPSGTPLVLVGSILARARLLYVPPESGSEKPLLKCAGSLGTDVPLTSSVEAGALKLKLKTTSLAVGSTYLLRSYRDFAIGAPAPLADCELAVEAKAGETTITLASGQAANFTAVIGINTTTNQFRICGNGNYGNDSTNFETHTIEKIEGNVITLTSALTHNYAVGGRAWFTSEPGAPQGELVRIRRIISETEAEAYRPIVDPHGYSTANEARLTPITWVTGTRVDRLESKNLQPAPEEGTDGVTRIQVQPLNLEYNWKPKVNDFTSERGIGVALYLRTCYEPEIVSPRQSSGNANSNYSYGYGVDIAGATEGAMIITPRSSFGAQTVTTNGAPVGGVPRFWKVIGGKCVAPRFNSGFHTHACAEHGEYIACDTTTIGTGNNPTVGMLLQARKIVIRGGYVAEGTGTGYLLSNETEDCEILDSRAANLYAGGTTVFQGHGVSVAGVRARISNFSSDTIGGNGIRNEPSAESTRIQHLRARRCGMPSPGTWGRVKTEAATGQNKVVLETGQGANFTAGEAVRIGPNPNGSGESRLPATVSSIEGDTLVLSANITANAAPVGWYVTPSENAADAIGNQWVTSAGEPEAFDIFAEECEYPINGASSTHINASEIKAVKCYGFLNTSVLPHFQRGEVLTAVKTWEPGKIANGAFAKVVLTSGLAGAVAEAMAVASFSLALPEGCWLTAQMTAAGTTTVYLYNNSGSEKTIASGTVRVTAMTF